MTKITIKCLNPQLICRSKTQEKTMNSWGLLKGQNILLGIKFYNKNDLNHHILCFFLIKELILSTYKIKTKEKKVHFIKPNKNNKKWSIDNQNWQTKLEKVFTHLKNWRIQAKIYRNWNKI